jgi:G3E family GTPase
MKRKLPVTFVGGFFGAGKTSLLHHFIAEHQGGYLAMLVENAGPLNLDAKALGGLCGAMSRTQDVVVEIPNGDEAAQVEWIAARLREFSEAGRFESVLIEVVGTSNAGRLGEYFGLLPGQSKVLAEYAELQQIICVVDALDFYRSHIVSAKAPGIFSSFQRELVEGASLVMLNKCDLIGDAERTACTRALRGINSHATILETAYGEMPGEMVTKAAPAQSMALAVGRSPAQNDDAKDPVLGSALYRAYRPFHPERFWNWYNAEHPGLLRVKGIIWLATRSLLVGGISRTLWQNSCGVAGVWWAALPREDWTEDPKELMRMQETWREPYGDRRQELVLIGDAAQLSALTKHLDTCLLTADEYARPLKEWSSFVDPFPQWDFEED